MVHEFWNTQPMPRDHREGVGEIDSSRTHSETPVTLPKHYEWSTCSINEISEFLSSHYIRDEHFSFKYSKDFVEWATEPDWNLGLRTKSGGKLVGFISGVPTKYKIHDTVLDVLQINFLCVHDSIRNIGLAPLLISEIRRRANAVGIWQAVYTAVAELPTPVAKTSYWHRLINVRKLNAAKFSDERERPHAVNGSCTHWLMTNSDVPRVTEILRKHMSQYSIAPVIDESYVRRWLLPKCEIVYSYLNEEGHFTSYYSVPYRSVKTQMYINQAYMFYDTGRGDLKSAVMLARNAGFDVYNTLDIGLNPSTLRDSKFLKGNGHNHCYVYNWSCGDIPPDKISMRFF